MKKYRIHVSHVVEVSSEEEAEIKAYKEWKKLISKNGSNYWVEELEDENSTDK